MPVAVLGVGEETLIASDIARAEARHLGDHLRLVTAVIEPAAIVEADPIERIHQAQVDIIGHALAAQRPEFFKQEGRGNDGGTGIEDEAVAAVHVGTATGRVQFLEHRDLITARGETDGRRQAAEATADDQSDRLERAFLGG